MSKGLPTVRTDKARATFLSTIAATCNITQACRAAGIGRRTAYKWREDDEEFAAAWAEAVDEAVEELEAEVRRRAKEGVDRPIVYQGEVTGHYKEYSDTLAMFLLKAHRPMTYVERLITHNTNNVTVKIEGDAANL